jgi:hypothetical protein
VFKGKLSSLLGLVISDKGIKFYKTDTRAPNFWALYNGVDLFGSKVVSKFFDPNFVSGGAKLTGGLVQVTHLIKLCFFSTEEKTTSSPGKGIYLPTLYIENITYVLYKANCTEIPPHPPS